MTDCDLATTDATAPERPDTWRRPPRRALVWALVIAVIAATVTWRTVHDERREAAVGQVIRAADALPDARSSYLLLPSGRLDVRATAAVDDVDGDLDVRSTQAPDDGSFVGLELRLTKQTFRSALSDPLALAGVNYTTNDHSPELSLVADGRRYPLRTDTGDEVRSIGAPGRYYVAVAGDPSTLELEADVDSYTQRVNLRTGTRSAGKFAPLYGATALNRGGPTSCGTATVDAPYRREGAAPTCRITARLRTPLLYAGGWAPAGRVWLVVNVQATPAEGYLSRASGGALQRYDADRLVGTDVELDGAASRVSGNAPADPGLVVAFLVPDSATSFGVLSVTTTVSLSGNGSTEDNYPETNASTRWQVKL